MRSLRTKPMSRIFDILFQWPANQDAYQGVLIWDAFLVKALRASCECLVHEKSLHKPSLVKLCIIVFNSSNIKETNRY